MKKINSFFWNSTAFYFVLCSVLFLFQFNVFSQTTVFENNSDGYTCYRIPAIVKSPKGELLAFGEGRKSNCNDHGDVDIVLKRSKNNGKTWSKLAVVVSNGEFQSGNSAPVYDMFDLNYKKGRLFLFYNTGTNASEYEVRMGTAKREAWYITSIDDGNTWSNPVNITAQVTKADEDWRALANTPGHAFQLSKGKYKGRIFVAANHSKGNPSNDYSDYKAHAYFSDDHGVTWKLSPTVEYPASNESTAAELSNGGVLMNIRDQSGKSGSRICAISNNSGQSWDTVYVETQLPDPVCQGSMLNYSSKKGQNTLLFSNLNHQTERKNLTLNASYDDGKTWKIIAVVCTGSSAYSDLVIPSKKQVGILYEKEEYSKIVYQSIPFKF